MLAVLSFGLISCEQEKLEEDLAVLDRQELQKEHDRVPFFTPGLPFLPEEADPISLIGDPEIESTGLIYSGYIQLKQGEWRPFEYFSKAAFSKGVQYRIRLVPKEGDVSLFAFTHSTDRNEWRMIRKSEGREIEKTFLQESDFQGDENFGVFWIQALEDSWVTLELYKKENDGSIETGLDGEEH